ncbi:hypothetical protein [Candidatus Similichlamydia epinepheli]|uniref:hypothetical protein n=1 Tax=Candidatus Similichlamydia epinepheli TaxID=1903953 RepID=UPI000D3668C3|nr:hypothetical protein [Candidatus Similichlamydia epinepheli]
MVGLPKFVRCQLSTSPFQKAFDEDAPCFLGASQVLFCGLALLGNCVVVQSIASKVFLALLGGVLSLSGAERIIYALSGLGIISYPFCQKLQSFMEGAFVFLHLPSIFVKCWMFASTVGLFFKATTLSVFSLTLLLLWTAIYLFFDFDSYFPYACDLSSDWTDFLNELIFCLNVLMTVWLPVFWKVPLF